MKEKRDRMSCELCGKTGKLPWTNKLADGTQFKRYCSKECTWRDAWGPIYRGSVPQKYIKEKA